VQRNMELWVGCIAGALQEDDYRAKLIAAGFADVDVDTWRVYDIEDARGFLTESGLDVDRIAPLVKDKFASAFIRARKPAAAACCDSNCCG
jgi:arsenite methyltransferase